MQGSFDTPDYDLHQAFMGIVLATALKKFTASIDD